MSNLAWFKSVAVDNMWLSSRVAFVALCFVMVSAAAATEMNDEMSNDTSNDILLSYTPYGPLVKCNFL